MAEFTHIINCFQHISGSCGALHSPFGGAPQQRRPLTPQTHPNRRHTHPPKRLAHPRSFIPPLSTLTSRATHANPHLPEALASEPSAIWVYISQSQDSSPHMARKPNTQNRALLMHLSGQPALKVRFAARNGCEWVNREQPRLCWLSARSRSWVALRKMLLQFSELVLLHWNAVSATPLLRPSLRSLFYVSLPFPTTAAPLKTRKEVV